MFCFSNYYTLYLVEVSAYAMGRCSPKCDKLNAGQQIPTMDDHDHNITMSELDAFETNKVRIAIVMVAK